MRVMISLVRLKVSNGLTRTQHKYEIPMPMKMISCMLCGMNASFESDVGVKI